MILKRLDEESIFGDAASSAISMMKKQDDDLNARLNAKGIKNLGTRLKAKAKKTKQDIKNKMSGEEGSQEAQTIYQALEQKLKHWNDWFKDDQELIKMSINQDGDDMDRNGFMRFIKNVDSLPDNANVTPTMIRQVFNFVDRGQLTGKEQWLSNIGMFNEKEGDNLYKLKAMLFANDAEAKQKFGNPKTLQPETFLNANGQIKTSEEIKKLYQQWANQGKSSSNENSASTTDQSASYDKEETLNIFSSILKSSTISDKEKIQLFNILKKALA